MTRENEFVCAVERQVRAHPEAPAHRASNGQTTTYGELWEASDRIAAALAPYRTPRICASRVHVGT